MITYKIDSEKKEIFSLQFYGIVRNNTEDCTKNRYDYDKSKTEKNDFTEQIEL